MSGRRDPDPLADPDVVAARQERDRHGDRLVEAAVTALPGWVERCIRARAAGAGAGAGVGPAELDRRMAEASAAVVTDARSALTASVRLLPGIEHGPAPLQVLRSLVVHPTEALEAMGVPPVERSGFDREAFPDDVYALSPATWSDVDPALHDLGLAWGAATAFLHQRIRRAVSPP